MVLAEVDLVGFSLLVPAVSSAVGQTIAEIAARGLLAVTGTIVAVLGMGYAIVVGVSAVECTAYTMSFVELQMVEVFLGH